MGASAERDPLLGDETPADPARIGSGLVQGGEGKESSAGLSVTSSGTMPEPDVHADPSRGEESLAYGGLRPDLLENHPEQDKSKDD